MGDLLEPSGGGAAAAPAAGDERPARSPSPSPSTSISSNPSPSSIGPERWARAENATRKIIYKVQPSAVSEERRREVIDYVQRLIRTCLGCEVFFCEEPGQRLGHVGTMVFPYGSVPLKTYLPDGDIDLTAFGGVNSEDVLADDMVSVLEGEDQDRAAEIVVKDVQLIRAEVKLVKCIVHNIVVDISFNQIGGLCTLCFLEQVDRLIGKDHLFKRSIILIKAWCYYESRILGAHHGLISTYALETLVLYIFHLFHSTLTGPLAVLYKFLDYFSKFDWENYCISLTGPVRLSSLPEFVETAEYGGGDLLLSIDFLRFCIDTFSVPSRGVDLNSRTFQPKHLNIVDPLKENNNLGRSVSKGNFYRIRSAFTYGARKLGRILMQPEADVDDGLCKFFSNTLDRHGSGRRPDVQCPRPVRSYNGFSHALNVLETESCPLDRVIPESEPGSCIGTGGDFRSYPKESSYCGFNDVKASRVETKWSKDIGEQEATIELLPYKISFGADQPEMGNALDDRISGDAIDLATARVGSLKISNDLSRYTDLDKRQSASPVGTPYHAPHLYFSNSMLSNVDLRNENLGQTTLKLFKENVYSGISNGSDGGINVRSLEKNMISDEDEVLVSVGLEDGNPAARALSCPQNLHKISCDCASASIGTLEPLNPMSDLGGDYDSHFSCLQYGRWCFEYASSMPALTMPPPPPSPFQMKNSWDGIPHPPNFDGNGYSPGSFNGVIPTPAFYTVNPLLVSGMAFGLEDMPKPQGTGTYFPNAKRVPQGYRPSAVKGRNQTSSRSSHNNGQNVMFTETNMCDHTTHELSQSTVSVDQSGSKNGPADSHPSFSARGKSHPNASGLVLQSESGLEFGSVGHIHVEAPLLDRNRQRLQRSITSSTQNQSPVSPTTGMQKLRPILSRDHDRVSVKLSYHLKDEDDFPPLSV